MKVDDLLTNAGPPSYTRLLSAYINQNSTRARPGAPEVSRSIAKPVNERSLFDDLQQVARQQAIHQAQLQQQKREIYELQREIIVEDQGENYTGVTLASLSKRTGIPTSMCPNRYSLSVTLPVSKKTAPPLARIGDIGGLRQWCIRCGQVVSTRFHHC
ncbi:hypothetical protein C8J56DRAFT_960869 [Mycena floridula]|nr:hypothetical protein C8J56DRAFT_960869 [Mycena floridula]